MQQRRPTLLLSLALLLLFPLGASAIPAITATMTDTPDNNPALPGDTITYTVFIGNAGDMTGTGVDFQDQSDSNETTSVPGSIRTTPLCRDDGPFELITNSVFDSGSTSVLDNDSDPDGTGGVNISEFDATSTNGGSVSVNTADGTFTYIPPLGFTGTDTFTYTINDTDGNDCLDAVGVATSAKVTMEVNPAPMVVVPEVVGLPQADAEAAIIGAGLTVGTITTVSGPTVPAGSVISQTPAGGTSVAPGASVDLVVSLGNTAPSITSTPIITATEDQLYTYDVEASDPDTGDVLTFSLDVAPTGMTIDPTSGLIQWTPTKAQVGDHPVTARVTDAGGLVDTQSFTIAVASLQVTVPDVVGLPQADAEAAITGAGLTVGAITTASSATVPAGNVISQNPLAGISVVSGSAVDLVTSLGPPASAELVLSRDVVPTQGAGGSVDVVCRVFDLNGEEIVPTPPVSLSTNDPNAVITNETNFAFPNADTFTIDCTVIGTNPPVSDSKEVVVLDDAIDPLYSDLSGSLIKLEYLLADALIADDADDVSGLQVVKDGLVTEIANIDLAGLAAAPPVPTGADVPTAAELLAAGDVPDPTVDVPFQDTILAIEQNFIDFSAFLSGLTPSTVTQADIDAMNALTAAGQTLVSTLESLGDPSQTAILGVNDALNNIVSNLLPNEVVDIAQLTVDITLTVPQIVRLMPWPKWRFALARPWDVYGGLQHDSRRPGAFYSQTQNAFLLIDILTSQTLAHKLRSEIIDRVYKPIIEQIVKNLIFLEAHQLGPSSPNAPVIDFVFGPSAGNVVPGSVITIFGSNFAPDAADNIIMIETLQGMFIVPTTAVLIGSPSILEGFPIPSGMCDCVFGLPEIGVVSVTTSGGTSNEVAVNVFP